MNKEYTIPSNIKTRPDFVEKILVSDNFMIASAVGLKKEINEDVVGYYINNDVTRICISDGHWGEEASSIIAKHWLNKELKFPISFERIAELSNEKNIENAFEKFFKEVFSYGAEDNASLVIFRNA